MKLSIVATLYNSAPYIEEFCRRASEAAGALAGDDYEIVLVNDGSPDNSLKVAVGIAEADSHVLVVDLSRNFGHHKAMMTGLSYARGEKIFLIDSDLEEEPEWLIKFTEMFDNAQCDVVYGVQERRKGNILERWTGIWFYRIFNLLTGLNIPENIVTARLMSRRYVDALLQHTEREMLIAGLWLITGFNQVPCMVRKHTTSQTTYTWRKKMTILVNSITSFSNTPLITIFYVGVIIFILAALYTCFLVANRVFFATPLSGWTSIMASVWLLGGMIVSFIGIIGIYLAKIFLETKKRPYTITRHIYGQRKK